MSKKSKNNKKDNDEEDEYELDDEDDVISDIIDEDEIDDEDEINDIENEQENENGCIMEDVNDDEIYYNIDIPTTTDIKYLGGADRISLNRLTKYEMVRILGERTKQITMGAKPLIKNTKNLTNEQIVNEEFKNNMIPFKIKRPLPNGKFEIWTLDELEKDHLLSLLE
jgi:DNA-directed RNA polymerase subunit K/omega